ncbi:MAG: hypothetical protein HY815_21140 [Candidatus Riflebacteria bacterium]|nr:hypothetical protein [Candidatus Riflebacteria bacterium]
MDRVDLRWSLAGCTPQELSCLDAHLSGRIAGVGWWRLLDEMYTGNEFANLHAFFRGPDPQAPPWAFFSAQYFPGLSIEHHLNLRGPWRALASLALRSVGVSGLKMSCLIVHSLTSVGSVVIDEGQEPRFAAALSGFLDGFRRQRPLNLVLFRSLGPELTARLGGELERRGFSLLPGYGCNWVRFGEARTLDAFLTSLGQHRRQRLRVSLRQLTTGEIESTRLVDPAQVNGLASSIMRIKEDAATRHREALSIPIRERPELFGRALSDFGSDALFRVVRHRDGAGASGASGRGIAMGTLYPEAKQHHTWYLLALEMIRDLIALDVRELNLGLGDDQLKAKVGARTDPQFSAITFFPGPLRHLCRALIVPRLKRL